MGKLELAHEGTLFLDEVGDMSLAMQAKLLRALQQREIERVGGNRSIPVDIRVIAATNKDLESMIKSGSFREDLYYRLSVVPIFLPPLRERKDDLVLLANCFLDEFSRQYCKNLTLSEEAVNTLYQYHWPGNVWELRNAIEHGVVLCTGDAILRSHLPRHVTFSGAGHRGRRSGWAKAFLRSARVHGQFNGCEEGFTLRGEKIILLAGCGDPYLRPSQRIIWFSAWEKERRKRGTVHECTGRDQRLREHRQTFLPHRHA